MGVPGLKCLQHSTRLEITRPYMIILDQLFIWTSLFFDALCSLFFYVFWYPLIPFDHMPELWTYPLHSITSGVDAKTPAKKGMAGLAGPWAWVSRAVVELCSKTMQDLG